MPVSPVARDLAASGRALCLIAQKILKSGYAEGYSRGGGIHD